MKVIDQSAEIIRPLDRPGFYAAERRLERYGRIAYQSEGKAIPGETTEPFLRKIISLGHESVMEHESMTVVFVSSRRVLNEFVRHRLASYTQESTRYCNYNNDQFGGELTFIKPWWFTSPDPNEDMKESLWLEALEDVEWKYKEMISYGASAQEAADLLPGALKAEIAVTANFREWRHIFRLRYLSNKALPQFRALLDPIYREVREYSPAIFDMGEKE